MTKEEFIEGYNALLDKMYHSLKAEHVGPNRIQGRYADIVRFCDRYAKAAGHDTELLDKCRAITDCIVKPLQALHEAEGARHEAIKSLEGISSLVVEWEEKDCKDD